MKSYFHSEKLLFTLNSEVHKAFFVVQHLKVEVSSFIGEVDFDGMFPIAFFGDFVEDRQLDFFIEHRHVTSIGIFSIPPHESPCP